MRIFSNFRYKLLALIIAAFVWFVAQGQTDIEKNFQIPVVLEGLSDDLVATELSADVVNIRVRGSRAALRNIETKTFEYLLPGEGAQSGPADFRVDVVGLERKLPRGSTILNHSPSNIEARFEPRAQRRVRIRPAVAGDPASGYQISSIVVEPSVVQIEGARSEVLRLTEVVTETVDVSGLDASLIREVGVTPEADHVWVLNPGPIELTVAVEAITIEDEAEPDPS